MAGPKIREKRYWQLGRGAGDAEVDRRRRENRVAVGAEKVGCREGCPPPHWRRGLGNSPEKKSILHLKVAIFSAFLALFLQFSCTFYT